MTCGRLVSPNAKFASNIRSHAPQNVLTDNDRSPHASARNKTDMIGARVNGSSRLCGGCCCRFVFLSFLAGFFFSSFFSPSKLTGFSISFNLLIVWRPQDCLKISSYYYFFFFNTIIIIIIIIYSSFLSQYPNKLQRQRMRLTSR